MNIVITGSLGHISKPLTEDLLEKGHTVTVISSNPERQKEIEALGAAAAIGSLKDRDFLTDTFKGADAVYTMVPPANYLDQNLDLLGYYHELGNNYCAAIGQAGIKKVVNLSSIGADLAEGNGILLGAHDVEQILNKVPSDVTITHIRPVGFYYNLYGFVPMIKAQGIMAANYGADDDLLWVSPRDIAAAAAEELTASATGRKARFIASDARTGHETARVLGEAIGKPDLQWVIIPDEEMEKGLVTAGFQPAIAAGMVEMYGSQHDGRLEAGYYRNEPAALGKVKLEEFAREFAAAFA